MLRNQAFQPAHPLLRRFIEGGSKAGTKGETPVRTPETEVQPKQNLAKQLAENALDQLADALACGKSETLLNYLAVMARFHRYSWNNLLLIALQECVT